MTLALWRLRELFFCLTSVEQPMLLVFFIQIRVIVGTIYPMPQHLLHSMLSRMKYLPMEYSLTTQCR